MTYSSQNRKIENRKQNDLTGKLEKGNNAMHLSS